eukprot:m.200514 g.200514  ORF g.200514 m.200514 type:complete len:61 (+) comp32771_c0_seq2:96-278(+)
MCVYVCASLDTMLEMEMEMVTSTLCCHKWGFVHVYRSTKHQTGGHYVTIIEPQNTINTKF